MFQTQLISIASAHRDHAGDVLAGGDALIAGGLDDRGQAQTNCVRFDAKAERFVSAAPLPAPAWRLSLTALGDGDALAIGVGSDGLAWRYHGAADAWRPVAPPAFPRLDHAALRLPDGRIAIVGGVAASAGVDVTTAAPLSQAEAYDPAHDRWTALPPLAQARRHPSALTLADGTLLVVGGKIPGAHGSHGQRLRSAERLPPQGAKFEPAGRIDSAERDLCRLADGRVIAHGGWLYDPRHNRWLPVEAGFRGGGPMLLWAGGRVVCFGALGEEVFDPAQREWTPVGPARKLAMRGHLALPLAGERVLLVGGDGAQGRGAAYAAIVRSDGEFHATEVEEDDLASATGLLQMLVDNGGLELDDAEEDLDTLVRPAARVLRFCDGHGAQAQALGKLLLRHDAVRDVFVSDNDLKRVLSQW